MDITQIPDDQLKQMASQGTAMPDTSSGDITKLSDDELKAMVAPKPFYDAIGANMTPAMKQDHPILSGIEQTAQDIGTLAEKGANGLSLGLLDKGLNKAGIQPPNFDNTAPENKPGLGLAGDATNILGAGKTIGAIAKPIVGAISPVMAGAISKVKNIAGNLISGPEKAQVAGEAEKFALGQKTTQQIEDAQRIGKVKIGIAKNNADSASKGYDDLSDTLKKQVSKYSDKQGQDLQDNLPKIFGQKSAEYGAEQDNILKNLPDNRKNIPVDKVVTDLEKVLTKYKILKNDGSGKMVTTDAELTPTEHKVLGIYKDLNNSVEPLIKDSPILGENGKPIQNINIPSGTISAEDLIKNQKYIEPNYGKAFDPDDKIKSEVAQVFSKNVSDAVPELQALRTRYAPFLQWKQAAIDNLKPFNGQYDVATGTVAKQGSGELDPSGQRLMAKLQQVYQSPYGAKVNALNKGINTTMLNKEQAAQTAQEGIQKLRNSIAQDIKNIRQTRTITSRNIDMVTNQLVQKYKNQRVLAAATGIAGSGILGIGAAIEHFIRHQASEGLSN